MSEAMPGSSDQAGRAHDSVREVDWLLLDADWVVTCDGSMNCLPSAGVAIDHGVLAAVGPTEEIRLRFRGRREADLRGHILLPGLVNTHTHAAMTCLRGLGSDLPLQRWLHEVIFPAEAAHVGPDFVYHGTLLACVEMLLGGVTTFCDGYFFEEQAARAALDAGIRAVLGQGILDFPTPDTPDPGRSRERAEAFIECFPEGETIRPSLFCHAPYTCSADTLLWVKELCRQHGMLFQIHLSETAGEVRNHMDQYGERPVFYLDRLGLLDTQTLCAHAVWVEPEEMDLMARRGACVSNLAESNMKLGSGVAPVPDMLNRGMRVGLGTDGCASNNDLDLFGEMDRVAKLHKVFRKDPVVLPASRVLRMATREGAHAIGWGAQIGSIEIGKSADLVAIDMNQPHLTPVYDPVSHIVYAVKAGDVRHVWVNGRQVVDDRKVLTVDAAEAMSTVARIARGV